MVGKGSRADLMFLPPPQPCFRICYCQHIHYEYRLAILNVDKFRNNLFFDEKIVYILFQWNHHRLNITTKPSSTSPRGCALVLQAASYW